MNNKISAPNFIYGTAWKKADTTRLVKLAIANGFTAIDTANQAKHYSEPLVGDALAELEKEGISRNQLFLQTKFTFASSQNENIPYDPNSDYETQVLTSFASSLQHLHTDYVDSYLLHGPYYNQGLTDADWSVWNTIEQIYESGKAKLIGVSNVDIEQLELLSQEAKIKPMIVQNRCFAYLGWDQAVREFCLANQIIYQGFSLLTANLGALHSDTVLNIAKRLNRTPAQVIFRFSRDIGIVPLTGTTNIQHMKEDLAIDDFELSSDDIEHIFNA